MLKTSTEFVIQSPNFTSPSAAGTPDMTSWTEFFPGTGPSATATEIVMVQANSTSKGSLVGAAVGGTIAACLVVLACAFFFLRRRVRGRASQRTTETDVSRRCADLESQVFVLREQVNRLEAQQVRFAGVSEVTYTHEKDVGALEKGAETKLMKEAPPTYGD
ncbi:hypothetical protein C8R44DRAFT_396747 [Mycena epipterygia]|nr:hypothetical protein C8R44DRAFT_396747 [Mycena epipterygia]